MIQKSTFRFLKSLKKNNNREWFGDHKSDYLEAWADFEQLVQGILDAVCKNDPSLSGLRAKDCMFRIYRDTRFSKDKTPYKRKFSAAFSRGGKMSHSPGYYFHIAPGGSFFGGGIWMPDTQALRKIRQEIDFNLKDFRKIISAKPYRSLFGPLEDESALSRPPKGYSDDNPAIEYLKMKSFFSGAELKDDVVLSPKFTREAVRIFKTVKPLVEFLTRALD